MRKLRRDEVLPGFPHHVIVRGNNRRNLVSYPRDREVMLTCMLRAHALEQCRVEALMLMRNHVHLVVTPDDALSLSRWMKSWEQRYAVYRNRDRDASGKLFEQRFESIAITSERQLAATIPYVEVNPTRAGCCDDPADWRWSTYSLHAGTGPTHELISELWQPSSWWLGLSADEAARGEMYRAHTARRLEAMDWRDLHPDSIRFESGGRRRVTPLGGAPKTQRPADLSVGGALLGSGSRGRYFFTSPRAKMLAT